MTKQTLILTASLFCASLSIAQSKGQADLNKAKEALEMYDLELARTSAENAIKKDPSLADAYYVLGAVKNADDLNSGMEDFSKAIELGTKNPEAWAKRALIKSYADDNEGAIADYTTAISMNPKEWMYYDSRGSVYRFMSEFDLSLKDYTTAIGMAQEDTEKAAVYIERAEVYAAMQKYQEALADATQSVRLFPEGSYAYMIRSEIYEALGDNTKACADLKMTMKLAGMENDEYMIEKIKSLCK